jgi:hypothetical protein
VTPAPAAPVAAPAPAPAPPAVVEADDSAAPLPSPWPGKALIGDTAPPRVSVRVARRARTGSLLRRGLPLRVRCSEACSASVRLTAGRGVSGAVRARALQGGKTGRLVIRLGRAGRARLSASAARRARLVVRARDRYGNRRTVTIAIVLLRR